MVYAASLGFAFRAQKDSEKSVTDIVKSTAWPSHIQWLASRRRTLGTKPARSESESMLSVRVVEVKVVESSSSFSSSRGREW